MTAKAEWLSASDAQALGLVPTGHVWNERSQEAEPRGLALERAQAERPLDLAQNFAVMEKNRQTLVKFVADRMEESEYKADKYPVSGKMHDFYILPNYDKKALTKQGAEKLAQLFGLRRRSTASVERVCTKEFAMAVVRVELVDRYGMPAGSGEAACSTAETGFKRSAKKYNDDFRAAMNDVVARAGKRAFAQAVVYATATDEIFDSSGEQEKAIETTGRVEEAAAPARLPDSPKLGAHRGKLLSEIKAEELVDLRARIAAKAKDPAIWQPVVDGIDEELDRRRGDDDAF